MGRKSKVLEPKSTEVVAVAEAAVAPSAPTVSLDQKLKSLLEGSLIFCGFLFSPHRFAQSPCRLQKLANL